MQLYLPLAQMSLDSLLIIALGALGGFLSGMFGIGGAFIVTPLLIMVGVPSVIAVGTQAAQLAGTALSGAIIQSRKGAIDIKMGLVLGIGSLGGVSLGALLFQRLRHAGQIDFAINLGYALTLSSIGFFMLRETVGSLRASDRVGENHTLAWGSSWKMRVYFPASNVTLSILSPIIVGFGCGILTAIFGVGSGFILVPAMIYVLRMPPALVAGTSMLQILFTAAYATFMQSLLNHNVDIILALVLLVGSVIGVRSGSYMATRISSERGRLLFVGLILLGAGKLWIDLLFKPHELFTLSIGSMT